MTEPGYFQKLIKPITSQPTSNKNENSIVKEFNLKPGTLIIFVDPKSIMEDCYTGNLAPAITKMSQWCFVPQGTGVTANAVHVAIVTDPNEQVNSTDSHAEKHQMIGPDNKPYKIVEVVANGIHTNYLDGTRGIETFVLAPLDPTLSDEKQRQLIAEQDQFLNILLNIINFFSQNAAKSKKNQIEYSIVNCVKSLIDRCDPAPANLKEHVGEFVQTFEKEKSLRTFKKGFICTEFAEYAIMAAAYLCFGSEGIKKVLDIDPISSPISLQRCLYENKGWFCSGGVWMLNEGHPELISIKPVQCCPDLDPKPKSEPKRKF